MIRYALNCDKGHDFESWFRDSEGYDAQRASGLVTCPACGSAEVGKTMMAPSLGRAERSRPPASAAPAPAEAAAPEPPAPVALVSEKEREMRAMLRTMRRFVEANSDDVGRRFPDEARKMHTGEIEHRSIRGEASGEEVKALIEDGIEVHPIPILPDERN